MTTKKKASLFDRFFYGMHHIDDIELHKAAYESKCFLIFKSSSNCSSLYVNYISHIVCHYYVKIKLPNSILSIMQPSKPFSVKAYEQKDAIACNKLKACILNSLLEIDFDALYAVFNNDIKVILNQSDEIHSFEELAIKLDLEGF